VSSIWTIPTKNETKRPYLDALASTEKQYVGNSFTRAVFLSGIQNA
jgi:hypothetical protein